MDRYCMYINWMQNADPPQEEGAHGAQQEGHQGGPNHCPEVSHQTIPYKWI